MPTLNWLTRNKDIRATAEAPYRLLEEVPEHSAGVNDGNNMLIQGDNLEALKALLPFYAGRVKCIYIDPPFNTKQAFPDYDDNLEHSIWLGMMVPRLELLREFLAKEGSIFIHLDDNELDYAKVIVDEIFQRRNFISRITIKARSPSAFSTVNPGVFKASEYLLWYCKDKSNFFQNRIWVPRDVDPAYNKYIENISDPYNEWNIVSIAPYLKEVAQKARSHNSIPSAIKQFIVGNADQVVRLAEIDSDGAGQDIVEVKQISIENPDKIYRHERVGREDIFILNGQQLLFYGKNIRKIDGVQTPARMLTNIWDDISWEGIAAEGGVRFPKAKKPERLIRRCLQLVTGPGDLVLDSFLGSGTTAAVAHKMGRRYIGIEMGPQALSHCAVRLKAVVDGDGTGVSNVEKWCGGGGFRFYRLGPPVFDEEGCIRNDVRFSSLAAHIWFSETNQPWASKDHGPFLGIHDGRAFALLYNGVLGDTSLYGGNVLTRATLAIIHSAIEIKQPDFSGLLTIYGEQSRMTLNMLEHEGIIFKQIPYDLKIRI